MSYPTFYLLCGLPGSGKTTFGKYLEQHKQEWELQFEVPTHAECEKLGCEYWQIEENYLSY